MNTMKTIEKIRQKIEELYDGEAPAHDQQCEFEDGYFTGLSTISNFLETLQEPEVDLEEEIRSKRKKLLDIFGPMNGEQSLAIEKFARHFYELGKNAK